jgi:hypothetical protein
MKKKDKKKWTGNKIVIEIAPHKPRIGVIFSKVVSNKKLKKYKVKHKNKALD